MGLFSFFRKKPLEIELNIQSAEELGWGPAWFNAHEFDDELLQKIKNYQKRVGLPQDGVVDVDTYRRRLTELQGKNIISEAVRGKFIICGGEKVPIKWDKVITFLNDEGMELPKSHYRPVLRYRNPRMFVVHWDATLSSHSTYKILMKRGISVHFAIDNDGTIFQWMDAEDIAYHAGNRIVNNRSIGVEVSNAYYLKFQDFYERKGFGSRPIWMNKEVHGKVLDPFLGFYPVQIEALKALTRAVHRAYPSISLKVPTDREGKMTTGVYPDVKKGRFSGIINHYHVTERKIDSAGCPLDEIVAEIKNEKESQINKVGLV